MTTTFFQSRAPEAGRTQDTLIQTVDIGGMRQRVEFCREIVWLCESTTCVTLTHGGRQVARWGSYCDIGSFMSSANSPGAASAMEHFHVDEHSSLIVQALTTVTLTPCLDVSGGSTTAGRNWRHVPWDWQYVRCGSAEGRGTSRVEPVVIAECLTWSSKRSRAANESVRDGFVDGWRRALADGQVVLPVQGQLATDTRRAIAA